MAEWSVTMRWVRRLGADGRTSNAGYSCRDSSMAAVHERRRMEARDWAKRIIIGSGEMEQETGRG